MFNSRQVVHWVMLCLIVGATLRPGVSMALEMTQCSESIKTHYWAKRLPPSKVEAFCMKDRLLLVKPRAWPLGIGDDSSRTKTIPYPFDVETLTVSSNASLDENLKWFTLKLKFGVHPPFNSQTAATTEIERIRKTFRIKGVQSDDTRGLSCLSDGKPSVCWPSEMLPEQAIRTGPWFTCMNFFESCQMRRSWGESAEIRYHFPGSMSSHWRDIDFRLSNKLYELRSYSP